jgi:cell division protease FtsH
LIYFIYQQGHTPGKNPAIQLNDINIGRDRIQFRVDQDKAKHEEALSNNSKLVQKKDVSVQSMNGPRSAYAMKVDANPELVKFLRDNQIPFRAAAKTRSDVLTVMARSSILLIYMLFLLRMYKTMAGGGNSGDTPGKLARLKQGKNGSDESVIGFNDIEGIDEAKFEVMELVDSLRNPQKYAILGARAPKGLLLEGPPGMMINCFSTSSSF